MVSTGLRKRRYFPLVLYLISFFLISLIGCSAGRYAQRDKPAGEHGSTVTEVPPPGKVFTGTASYYGDEFNGRQTTSGEIYDPEALTAAHQEWPMGVYIKVTNLKNNRQVTLKVNDRMPYHADRILDISRKAARLLGMLKDGLARVRIEILK